MTAHELARRLLAGPDLPAVMALDHETGYLAHARDARLERWQPPARSDQNPAQTDGEPVIVLLPETWLWTHRCP